MGEEREARVECRRDGELAPGEGTPDLWYFVHYFLCPVE